MTKDRNAERVGSRGADGYKQSQQREAHMARLLAALGVVLCALTACGPTTSVHETGTTSRATRSATLGPLLQRHSQRSRLRQWLRTSHTCCR